MEPIIKKGKTFIVYLISSGISFIVDLGAFYLILLFLDYDKKYVILLASYLARAISSIINYLINRKYVFSYSKKSKDSSWWKYFVLVVINITISGTLVTEIYNFIHMEATFIKAVVDSIIFVANYFIQKLLIFKK